MKTITIPETRFEVLFEMLIAQPPRLLQDDQVKGFLLSPEQYEAVIELLEDIEDLQDALQAEAEYEAGQGRPFTEYGAERKARIAASATTPAIPKHISVASLSALFRRAESNVFSQESSFVSFLC